MIVGSNPVAVSEIADIVPVSSKEFFDVQATREWHDKNTVMLIVCSFFNKSSLWLNR